MTTEPSTPRRSSEASELLAEIRRRKRYQHFRPWYEDVRVVDAEPGDGFGIDYASRFSRAASAIVRPNGPRLAISPVSPVVARAPEEARFHLLEADLVLGFGLLEGGAGLSELAATLQGWNGRVVLSADFDERSSPGGAEASFEKPFAARVENAFMGRTVRFLSQSSCWPFGITEGLSPGAASWIAVVGDGDLPNWPRIGLAMPTVVNVAGAAVASLELARCYPGELRVALVANGTPPAELRALRELEAEHPAMLRVFASPMNLGFAGGCNLGLAQLAAEGAFGHLGVCNDDVVPAFDCVCELVEALRKLEDLGLRPGMIGPVSNRVSGAQSVDIGHYEDLDTMLALSSEHHRLKASTVTQAAQVRGLLLLFSPALLDAVGGFDTRFGIGNFEDDDFNLRSQLAGFTNWIAEGAFLYHEGSATFRALRSDYDGLIERNARLFAEKWRIERLDQWPYLRTPPPGVSLYVPLDPGLSRATAALRSTEPTSAVAPVRATAEPDAA